MKMKLLATALLVSSSTIAHAGFFDSFLGGDKEEVSAEVEAKAVTVETKSVEATKVMATEKTTAIESANSMDKGLLASLSEQLGVTDAQAEGGMGALMQLAQSSLSSGEFSQLSDGVPNMDTLLAAAPEVSSLTDAGGMSSLLSGVTDATSSIEGVAKLTEQFKALGLSSDMIVKYGNMAMSYFSGGSETDTSALLQKGLSSILG